jgi:hypothetical protein
MQNEHSKDKDFTNLIKVINQNSDFNLNLQKQVGIYQYIDADIDKSRNRVMSNLFF